MKTKIIFLLTLSVLIMACQNKDKAVEPTPKLSAYTQQLKDEKAAELVAKMMDAMGGAKKWEELKYVSWTFFGSRHLVWDKLNNRVRIESPRDSSIYLVNLDENTGKYAHDGNELLDSVKLAEKVQRGKSIWINDMYWVFMPFKLQDHGVTVTYQRQDTTLIGAMADVLELTFENVGDTPDNKYEVYIDRQDHLIKQWDFFAKANQEKASRAWPWDNYSEYNGLLLSSDRSDKSGPSNIRVYDHLDDKVFTSFETFSFYE